jgi:hypothetical protein
MTEIPPEAITVAAQEIADHINSGQRWGEAIAESALKVAAPLIAAAERDRIIGYICHGNDGEGDMIDRLDDILQGRA